MQTTGIISLFAIILAVYNIMSKQIRRNLWYILDFSDYLLLLVQWGFIGLILIKETAITMACNTTLSAGVTNPENPLATVVYLYVSSLALFFSFKLNNLGVYRKKAFIDNLTDLFYKKEYGLMVEDLDRYYGRLIQDPEKRLRVISLRYFLKSYTSVSNIMVQIFKTFDLFLKLIHYIFKIFFNTAKVIIYNISIALGIFIGFVEYLTKLNFSIDNLELNNVRQSIAKYINLSKKLTFNGWFFQKFDKLYKELLKFPSTAYLIFLNTIFGVTASFDSYFKKFIIMVLRNEEFIQILFEQKPELGFKILKSDFLKNKELHWSKVIKYLLNDRNSIFYHEIRLEYDGRYRDHHETSGDKYFLGIFRDENYMNIFIFEEILFEMMSEVNLYLNGIRNEENHTENFFEHENNHWKSPVYVFIKFLDKISNYSLFTLKYYYSGVIINLYRHLVQNMIKATPNNTHNGFRSMYQYYLVFLLKLQIDNVKKIISEYTEMNTDKTLVDYMLLDMLEMIRLFPLGQDRFKYIKKIILSMFLQLYFELNIFSTDPVYRYYGERLNRYLIFGRNSDSVLGELSNVYEEIKQSEPTFENYQILDFEDLSEYVIRLPNQYKNKNFLNVKSEIISRSQ
ncbi:hypothetical protein MmarC5_1159 [Methanococcus maripaludis C5]|uniref:Uncharacterized protein n=3 Tax=Methanococcus maripaludis TaxID=39152 RepID=A4FZ24_METM5|nr:hypothetical protein [Methanococcus maripaludis]ABO35458.1 hypothetical protein MmarC5_1159 [Methanococcus maripaludis C5]MBA2861012.1 hypothetical protein [Methanococcus maripaludis]